MSRSISNRFVAAALAGVIAITSAALAAPSAADIATARELVVEGRKLRASGEFEKAVEKLKAAHTLYPTPVTGHELALAYRDAGKLIEARELSLRIVKMPVESDEGKASETARAECTKMVAELGPRIGQLTLALTGVPPGATPTVTIDDEPVPAVVLSEPRAINPGKHVAVVTASGVEGRVEFAIADGEKKTVPLALPEPKPAPAAASAATPTPSAAPTTISAPPPPPPAETSSGGPGWLTWTGFGVAGLGVLIGTISGMSAVSYSNKLQSACTTDGRCPSREASNVRSYDTAATISTISFIVAGVGLTLAVVDLATSATAPRKTASGSISIGLGPSSVGLVGTF